MRVSLFLILSAFLFSCESPQESNKAEKAASVEVAEVWQEPALPMVAQLEKVHRVEAFRKKKALAFDLELYFGGKLRIDARITATAGSDRVRVDRLDGTSLLYFQGEGFKIPADSDWPGARFDLLTWQYFAMAPFKLSDPGTHWTAMEGTASEGREFRRGKLTFGENVGDAPDDWYIVYQDESTGLLEAMAYIVTFSKSRAEAEKNPHAIRYSDYQKIDGIPFATRWTFWNWTEEDGFTGSPIGEATLSRIEFVDPDPDFFRPKEGSEPIPRERI